MTTSVSPAERSRAVRDATMRVDIVELATRVSERRTAKQKHVQTRLFHCAHLDALIVDAYTRPSESTPHEYSKFLLDVSRAAAQTSQLCIDDTSYDAIFELNALVLNDDTPSRAVPRQRLSQALQPSTCDACRRLTRQLRHARWIDDELCEMPLVSDLPRDDDNTDTPRMHILGLGREAPQVLQLTPNPSLTTLLVLLGLARPPPRAASLILDIQFRLSFDNPKDAQNYALKLGRAMPWPESLINDLNTHGSDLPRL